MTRAATLLLGLLLQLPPGQLAGQQAEHATYQPAPGEMVSVAAGERYAAGPLHRVLFGDRYRDLWSAPIEVPVLDLGRFAGGLVPDERGGGMQTSSLHFRSGDGREFSFRSLDKDPTDAVPEPFRGTVVHRLVQDATSAMHPGGAVLAPVLLEAAGVLHAPPQLVVMPDDPRLGEHRAHFAGLLGTIEERPEEGFAGADEVGDTDDLFQRLRADPRHQVDAPGFLAARLMDHFLGDWDRHEDQWRWAGFEQGNRVVWRPIPRDRDQALARYDGLVTGLARKANPKMTTFGREYPGDLEGFTRNGSELDRRLLASLDRAAFDSVAAALQAALTDSVIAAAVDRLPAAYRARLGEATAESLRHRRDGLAEHARRWYRYLASDVDVWATDAADYAEAAWESDALQLRISSAPQAAPWFERRFVSDETREVRLFLREGDDRVTLAGPRRGPRLLVIRELRDSVTGREESGRVQLHEHLPEPRGDEDEESGAAEPTRDWGSAFSAGPRAGYDPDLGLLLGAGAGWTDYAFRHDPYRARTDISAAYATAARGVRAELTGELRRADPRTRFALLVRASEIELVRFTGLGNETPDEGAAAEVDHWRLTVAPAVERTLSPSLIVRAGPLLEYGTTSGPGPRGRADFGRLGGSAGLEVRAPTVRGTLRGDVFPPVWSAEDGFGALEGELRTLIPIGGPSLAARLGARRVWGEFPYDDAAFLGGAGTLRGYDYQRFAGDAMLYGGLELRLPVARVLTRTVPTRIGLIALGDAGRVWAEGTRSDRIHASAGGGVWLEFFEARHAVSVVHARGREGGRWYLQLGLPY